MQSKGSPGHPLQHSQLRSKTLHLRYCRPAPGDGRTRALACVTKAGHLCRGPWSRLFSTDAHLIELVQLALIPLAAYVIVDGLQARLHHSGLVSLDVESPAMGMAWQTQQLSGSLEQILLVWHVEISCMDAASFVAYASSTRSCSKVSLGQDMNHTKYQHGAVDMLLTKPCCDRRA